MKRFFLKLAAFVLALCLPFTAYAAYVQTRPAVFSGSMMGASHYKLEKLLETDGARIIVVGGSSAPYSIISDEVADAAGMPCVNMGCTAYLGLAYYTAQLHGALHEGDIVILAPEYVMYENGYSTSTVWMAAESHLDILSRLPADYRGSLLRGFWAYSRQKLELLKTRAPDAPTGRAAYTAAGFGEWGDITVQRDNILEHKYNTQDCRSVSAGTLSPEVAQTINDFAAYAKQQGAQVYLTYAPFNRLALEGGTDGVDALQDNIMRQCPEVCWLGSLSEGVMPEDYFYDSNNHLNSMGAELRTQDLIEDLRAEKCI